MKSTTSTTSIISDAKHTTCCLSRSSMKVASEEVCINASWFIVKNQIISVIRTLCLICFSRVALSAQTNEYKIFSHFKLISSNQNVWTQITQCSVPVKLNFMKRNDSTPKSFNKIAVTFIAWHSKFKELQHKSLHNSYHYNHNKFENITYNKVQTDNMLGKLWRSTPLFKFVATSTGNHPLTMFHGDHLMIQSQSKTGTSF